MSDRQAWLEARRKGLGSTDAPAILGLSRWRSGRDVKADKLGLAPERPVSPPMEWGLRLEDAIAAAWAERTGGAIRRPTSRISRAKHVRTFPMIASLDRFGYVAGRKVDLELKSARSDDGFVREEDQDDVPAEKRIPADYYVQVQHQLEVTDLEQAEVAVLFGGSDFRVYRIPRDRDFGADLVEEEGRWWHDYIVEDADPPVGPDDGPYLARRFPVSVEETKVASSEMILIASQIMGLDATIARFDRERSTLVNRVKEYLGEAARMDAGDAVVSWRSHDRTTVGWKEIAETLRRIIERAKAGDRRDLDAVDLLAIESIYTRTSPVRPFRVDRKKEG